MADSTGTGPLTAASRGAARIALARRRVRRRARDVIDRHLWKRFYGLASYLRSALWVVPLFAIALAFAIIPVFRWLDPLLDLHFVTLGIAGATALYQTLITLSLSFMVFTFGSLLVAIQVASGQLTPRIIATTLLRDNVVRSSVGLFVFTLIAAIMAANRLESRVNELIALLLAILGVASIAMFLFLIDYAARLLRPVSILSRVGNLGVGVIEMVYPDPAGHASDDRWPTDFPRDADPRIVRHVGRSEIILAIDLPVLVREAYHSDGVVEVIPQIGHFVMSGEALFALHGGAAKIDEGILRGTVALGPERTMEQDPLFSFRIMVDIGLKALSPAINDPTTGVLALDQIHRLLALVGARQLRGEAVVDYDGVPRVILRTPNWEDFVAVSCIEIRACGANNVQIARRMRAMLDHLLSALPPHRHPALLQERSRLDEALASLYANPGDLALARIGDRFGIGGGTEPVPSAGR